MVMVMKKQIPNQKHKKPFHLHLEYFLRTRFILGLVLGLLGIAIVRADNKMLGLLHDAYGEGYGMIGAYLRNETVHPHMSVSIVRIPTISGQ